MSAEFLEFVQGYHAIADDLTGQDWYELLDFKGSLKTYYRQVSASDHWPLQLAERYLAVVSQRTPGLDFDELRRCLILREAETPIRVAEIQRCSFLLPSKHRTKLIDSALTQAMDGAKAFWSIQSHPPVSLCEEPVQRAIHKAVTDPLGSFGAKCRKDLNRFGRQRREFYQRNDITGRLDMHVLMLKSAIDALYQGRGRYAGLDAGDRHEFFADLCEEDIPHRGLNLYIIDDGAEAMPADVRSKLALYDGISVIDERFSMMLHRDSLQRSFCKSGSNSDLKQKFLHDIKAFIQRLLMFCAHTPTQDGAIEYLMRHYPGQPD